MILFTKQLIQYSQYKLIALMGKSKKYNTITYEMRLDLIRMVCEEDIPCVEAAKNLEISFSTAKMIIKNYRENGKIFQKKEDKIRRECLEEYQAKNELRSLESPTLSSVQNFSMPIIYFYTIPTPEIIAVQSPCMDYLRAT